MKRSPGVPTGAVGHLQVLEALDGAGHVSQRRVAELLGMPPSRVNRIIRTLVQTGRVRVADEAVRPYAYRLTPAGRRYLNELSYDHYATVVGRFRQVQGRIRARLAEIRSKGIERVAFYGAGEVMEVAYPLAREIGLDVVGVVDDDPTKHGRRDGFAVGPSAAISGWRIDAVVITTLRHTDEIRRRVGPAVLSGVEVVQV